MSVTLQFTLSTAHKGKLHLFRTEVGMYHHRFVHILVLPHFVHNCQLDRLIDSTVQCLREEGPLRLLLVTKDGQPKPIKEYVPH